MTIEEKLGRGVSLAVKELYGVDTPADKVQLQKLDDEFNAEAEALKALMVDKLLKRI